MEVLHPCCCGIDVHAKTAVACLIKQGKRQTRTFSTMTDDLLRLSDWLTAGGLHACRHREHGRLPEAGLQHPLSRPAWFTTCWPRERITMSSAEITSTVSISRRNSSG